MKKSLSFILLSILSLFSLSAQQEYYKFLFDHFQKGKIVYTNSESRETKLNYETITEKIYFMLQDSTIWELAQPEKIALVYINDRAFEYINKGVFYERIKAGSGFLYVRWKSNVVSTGKEGGYGIKSNTGAIENINQTYGKGSIYGLKAAEDFKTVSRNMYYLKNKNKFKYFTSFNALAKQFKKHEATIKAYIKTEDLDFKKLKDIEKAVAYAYQLAE
ncbi:MAG: hypothetical protein E6767_06705 [Dysgonomonas sp.]|nr:hypothetical protein [Dysgonomonas sp.]